MVINREKAPVKEFKLLPGEPFHLSLSHTALFKLMRQKAQLKLLRKLIVENCVNNLHLRILVISLASFPWCWKKKLF